MPTRNRASYPSTALPGAAVATIVLLAALILGGCTAVGQPSTRHDSAVAPGGPSVSSLQQLASSAANGGNVNVRFIEGVAYVTGRVDTVMEVSNIERVLNRVEGVERVETNLQRGM